MIPCIVREKSNLLISLWSISFLKTCFYVKNRHSRTESLQNMICFWKMLIPGQKPFQTSSFDKINIEKRNYKKRQNRSQLFTQPFDFIVVISENVIPAQKVPKSDFLENVHMWAESVENNFFK